MTANELFSEFKSRGQNHISMKQAAWLKSLVINEIADAQYIPTPRVELNWMYNGHVRSLIINPMNGSGQILGD